MVGLILIGIKKKKKSSFMVEQGGWMILSGLNSNEGLSTGFCSNELGETLSPSSANLGFHNLCALFDRNCAKCWFGVIWSRWFGEKKDKKLSIYYNTLILIL